MLLHRIQSELDKIILPVQAGFRKNHTTSDQILSIRLVIERCRTQQQGSVITFIDFQKAFDSINRNAIKQVLIMYGVPEKLVNAVMCLYNNTSSKVRVGNTESSSFSTTTGILQGDTLAPFIFIVVLDWVLRMTYKEKEGAFTVDNNCSIACLCFADDIGQLNDNLKSAIKMLNELAFYGKMVGLKVNRDKTEYITIPFDPTASFPFEDGYLVQTADFKYLGSFVWDCQKDFKIRRGYAWAAASRLQKLSHSNLSQTLKRRVFTCIVEAILLYGTETYAMSTTLSSTVDACHWPAKVSNNELYRGLSRCSAIIQKRRLRLFGHSFRHPKENTAGAILNSKLKQKYRLGGHRRCTYIKTIEADLKTHGIAKEDALNRELWHFW